MRAHRRQIDSATIADANDSGKEYVEATIALARAFLADADKSTRRRAGLCKLCYYQSARMGGCVLTYAQCGLCDEQLSSGTTNIDVLCQSCAVENGLCKHCGADLEFVNRRKRVLPEPTATWAEEE